MDPVINRSYKEKYEELKNLYEGMQMDHNNLAHKHSKVNKKIRTIRNEREYLLNEISKYNASDFESDQSDDEDNESDECSDALLDISKPSSVKKLKKPNNPFLLYVNDMKSTIRAENPEANSNEISLILGKRWKNLNEKEKKLYQKRYDKEKEVYEAHLILRGLSTVSQYHKSTTRE